MCGDKYSTKPTVQACCKTVLVRLKVASYTEVKSDIPQWLRQQPASFFLHRAFRSLLIDGTRFSVSTKSDDMLKSETVILLSLFITRESSYCFQRVLAIAVLSVCLSHRWISQKQCKLESSSLHCRLPGRL